MIAWPHAERPRAAIGEEALHVTRTLMRYWGGWIRTSDLLINSQALCQLSYTPSVPRRMTPTGGNKMARHAASSQQLVSVGKRSQ